MGIAEGQTLVGEVSDGELRLMSRDTAVRKAQALVRKYVPEGVSLVDELIAERRAEAQREETEALADGRK
ncbi:MAG: AbrB/MazE/SpoVT family DNA-binding domain-containing protein [Devosia nanyangense]|uniref:AbrB/MazE/SpoVT family DNA-binding domain-containing protein n=1 Tax=Devosia nanyangense TaxID=1228055 RepID=A0A933NXG1_9HYPH|nr:AbrB/MazE/SpoVT family DNA-binding domain-containing protein [Devosia nanyangense]